MPLKVAFGGIDRYFERYYRKGPRRRPVKIDFCEADILDVFDEWRRATGLTASGLAGADAEAGASAVRRKRGTSLPEHLQRVLLRLSNLRVNGVLGEIADPMVDRVSAELDAARAKPAGVRGDERTATLARLAGLDVELIALVKSSVEADVRDAADREAAVELAPFRATMPAPAFERVLALESTRILRERLDLPVIAFF